MNMKKYLGFERLLRVVYKINNEQVDHCELSVETDVVSFIFIRFRGIIIWRSDGKDNYLDDEDDVSLEDYLLQEMSCVICYPSSKE
jgi:hypothetical protein